ncbi:MAG: alpha-L-fucosidase [Candidatus Latescibacterota bacterium]
MRELLVFFLISVLFPLFPNGAAAFGNKENYRTLSLQALEKLKTVQAEPFKRTSDPDAQWFPDAGFGLFMHWGIHSVAGIQPSWAMIEGYPYGTDRREFWGKGYYSLLTKFNPQNYDPDQWIAAAKAAGMTYAVLTVKHHDGYALWPSEYGKISTKQYMNGRDLIRPYVEACRKYGLKVGLYFSVADWGYPGFPVSLVYGQPNKNTRMPEQDRVFEEQFEAYSVGQLSEILTRWGKIDLLWFDGGGYKCNNQILAWMRQIQPHIVINDRLDGRAGDYSTPEVNMPDEAPDGWWENCVIWSGHWGYSPDMVIESSAWVLEKLAIIRSWGGNLLLNIGPAPDGTMRPGYYIRTQELASWMTHSRDSLIGAGPVRNWKKFSPVPVTRRENIWYLHIFPKNRGPVDIQNVPEPEKVTLLRTGKGVPFIWEGNKLTLTLSVDMRTGLDDVVELTWKEEPKR